MLPEAALLKAVEDLAAADKAVEARGLCAKAESLFPRSPAVKVRAAELALVLGLVPEALESVRKAVELDPRSVNLLLRGAHILESARRYEDALELLARAVAAEPGAREAVLHAARLQLWRGDYKEARELAAKASGHEALRIQGAAAGLLGKGKEAAKLLDEALAEAPKDIETLCWKGELARRAGDIDAASGFFARAREITPYPPLGALLNESLIAIAQKRPVDQVELGLIASWVPESLVDVRANLPKSAPGVWINAANWRGLAEAFESALGHMKGNRSLTPTFLWEDRLVEYVHYFPRHYLVQLQSTVRFGDYRRVIGIFDRLVAETPEESYLYSHRAEVKLWVGLYAEALEDFKRARGLNDRLLWPKVGLGAATLLLGRLEEAKQLIETAALEASESIISTWRGEMFRKLGEPERALQELDRIREELPFRPAVYLNKALALCELGREDEAAAIVAGLKKHAPEFIADAESRAKGSGAASVAASAFDLMRGCRSSWMYSYVVDDRLKIIQLRGIDMNRAPANLHGFSWLLHPDSRPRQPSLR